MIHSPEAMVLTDLMEAETTWSMWRSLLSRSKREEERPDLASSSVRRLWMTLDKMRHDLVTCLLTSWTYLLLKVNGSSVSVDLDLD